MKDMKETQEHRQCVATIRILIENERGNQAGSWCKKYDLCYHCHAWK